VAFAWMLLTLFCELVMSDSVTNTLTFSPSLIVLNGFSLPNIVKPLDGLVCGAATFGKLPPPPPPPFGTFTDRMFLTAAIPVAAAAAADIIENVPVGSILNPSLYALNAAT